MDRAAGTLVLSRYRYRWKDRHDDLVKRRNPWPLRIEFTLLVLLTVLSLGSLFFPS